MTDSELILINLPNGTAPDGVFEINGVFFTPDDILDLPEVNGSVPRALAYIFRCLESDQKRAESIGKYSYEKYLMRGSDYWNLQAASASLGAAAPNVALRPPEVRGHRRVC